MGLQLLFVLLVTEPKIKTYFTTLGKDLAEAQKVKDELAAVLKPYSPKN